MFDVVIFAGIGLLGGLTVGTVENFGRIDSGSTRDPLWRQVAWAAIGAAIGALVALAFRLQVFYTPF